MRKNILEFTLALNVTICIVFAFGIYAGAADVAIPTPNAVQPEAFTIEELNIVPNYAILEGQTLQMQVEEFEEYVWLSSVEWASSKPDVISCTKSGEIKGLKEGKATITVKAKVGNASDSITVYCARKLSNSCSSRISNPFAWSCQTPSFLHIQTLHFNIFPFLMTGKLDVKGVYDSYFYVEFERSEKQFKGFILQSWMPNNIASSEVFKQLSTYDLDAYVGINKDTYKVTTNYKGNIKWTVSDTQIIDFDSSTGKVFCKVPGIATISATAGDTTLVCTVHSIYVWPQKWTGTANEETFVYKAKGTAYQETSAKLFIGDKFTVSGDMGNDDGWAYGVSESGAWGYIPINKISVKGTISQYRNLKTTLNGVKVPWIWPVRDTKDGVSQSSSATYVSSPYGWRNLGSSSMHKGIDITTGIPGQIKGYDVVSTCAGKVVYVGYNPNSGYGYCLSVRSDEKDPVTGLNYVVTYMHLKSPPLVSVDNNVSTGQLLGYVGNTSSDPDMGYHLHFEINCKNSSLNDGSGTRNSYDNLINPIFIFADKCIVGTASDKKAGKIVINQTSDAVSKYRGAYWYGDNTGKENNQ